MGFNKSTSKREVDSSTILPPGQEKLWTGNTLHLKQLEKEPKPPKVSRRKEIIKIRTEINVKEMKKKVNVNKTKSWFSEKINKIDKPLARFIKKKRKKNQIKKN